MSHICHWMGLQGSCMGATPSATGCANSHKRDQSHQHEAVRVKEIHNKNCQQNSRLNKNRNKSVNKTFSHSLCTKKIVIYLFYVTGLLNLFKKFSKIYFRDIYYIYILVNYFSLFIFQSTLVYLCFQYRLYTILLDLNISKAEFGKLSGFI